MEGEKVQRELLGAVRHVAQSRTGISVRGFLFTRRQPVE